MSLAAYMIDRRLQSMSVGRRRVRCSKRTQSERTRRSCATIGVTAACSKSVSRYVRYHTNRGMSRALWRHQRAQPLIWKEIAYCMLTMAYTPPAPPPSAATMSHDPTRHAYRATPDAHSVPLCI